MNEIELLKEIHESLLAVEHHLAILVRNSNTGFPHDHPIVAAQIDDLKKVVRSVVHPKDQA